jgi:hypothetical protein
LDAAAIVSIAISVVFAIVGFYFSYISGITLAKIEAKLDGEVESLKNLLNETHKRYEDLVRTSLSLLSKVDKSVQSEEGTKDSAKELNEALQGLQQKLFQDPASVLSPESKFEERKKDA